MKTHQQIGTSTPPTIDASAPRNLEASKHRNLEKAKNPLNSKLSTLNYPKGGEIPT